MDDDDHSIKDESEDGDDNDDDVIKHSPIINREELILTLTILIAL